jgi:hypothetical protein
MWLDAKEGAKLSCIASVYTAAGKSPKVMESAPTNGKRELTRDEVAELLEHGGPLDCSRDGINPDEFYISVGDVNKKSSGRLRVWVVGPDGISGTKDDLIIPYEEMDR